jgi:hypothetical protein
MPMSSRSSSPAVDVFLANAKKMSEFELESARYIVSFLSMREGFAIREADIRPNLLKSEELLHFLRDFSMECVAFGAYDAPVPWAMEILGWIDVNEAYRCHKQWQSRERAECLFQFLYNVCPYIDEAGNMDSDFPYTLITPEVFVRWEKRANLQIDEFLDGLECKDARGWNSLYSALKLYVRKLNK